MNAKIWHGGTIAVVRRDTKAPIMAGFAFLIPGVVGGIMARTLWTQRMDDSHPWIPGLDVAFA